MSHQSQVRVLVGGRRLLLPIGLPRAELVADVASIVLQRRMSTIAAVPIIPTLRSARCGCCGLRDTGCRRTAPGSAQGGCCARARSGFGWAPRASPALPSLEQANGLEPNTHSKHGLRLRCPANIAAPRFVFWAEQAATSSRRGADAANAGARPSSKVVLDSTADAAKAQIAQAPVATEFRDPHQALHDAFHCLLLLLSL